MEATKSWLQQHDIVEVECIVADLNGVLRGKLLPVSKFVKSLADNALFLPSSTFLVCIDGRYSGSFDEGFGYADPDMRLVIDGATLCMAPGSDSRRAFVFADAFHENGDPWMASPRNVLKSVLALYAAKGWMPVVAPEIEFYLTAPNPDPNMVVTAPLGPLGRRENVQHPYDLQAMEAFEPVTRQIYDHCAIAGIALDALTHESGTGQIEINLLHGGAVALADQVMLFKRIARAVATSHSMHATFMAKPIAEQAGSSMHVHMSVTDDSGNNLFALGDGSDTPMFSHFIGGLQRYIPEIMPLFAPNVNSFRRIRPNHSAPANIEWSRDNRSCGLRVPAGGPAARRIENRLPGADANPYLALAGSLLAGYLGVEQAIAPSAAATGNAYKMPSTLPVTMDEALKRFAACGPVRAVLGENFTHSYLRVKSVELETFQSVVTAWERDHLLTRV